MKKTFSLIMVVLMVLIAVLSLCACNGDGGVSFGKKNKHDENALLIQAFDGGYGLDYLEAIAEAYTNIYGVPVEIEPIYDYTLPVNKIQGEIYVADLLFNVTNNTKDGSKGLYLNLDDVYASTPTEGETQTVAQKLGNKASDYLYEGHYYEMPHAMGYTGLFYNKTSLDTIYQGSTYTLPVTTDELIAMCNEIKAKGTGWGFVHTNANNAEYYTYLRDILIEQYMGYEAYQHYFEGEYLNSQGEWVFADDYADLANAWKDARLSALEVCSTIVNYDNGYTPKSCKMMDFNEAQAYFWGVTSKTDKRPVAFMMNGDWLYNEIKSMAGAKAADIRMMRVPINSAIINVLESVSNDTQLAECVRYADSVIDGKGGVQRPSYISDADLARLTEARKLVRSSHTQHSISIPYNTKHEAEARNFLRFFASDEACRIYSQHELGMFSPYSNTIYSESSLNEFTRSVNAVAANSITCPGTGIMTKLSLIGEHRFFSFIWFTRKLNEGTAPQAILDTFVNEYAPKWADAKRVIGK